MQIETVTNNAQIDERRALIMSLQALVDVEMLAVVAALIHGERTLPELATTLNAQPSLSRGPLGRMIYLEIVVVREQAGQIICRLNKQRFYSLNGALQRLSKEVFTSERPATPGIEALDEADQRVLRNYIRGERLADVLPDGPQRMDVVARWLAGRFEHGRRYPERELNEIIARHHPDFATLRRAMVDFGYMAREREVYWRLEK